MKKKLEKKFKQIRDYLINKNSADLIQIIKDSHPADLGEIFNHLEKEERKAFITFFEPKEAAFVLPEMNPIFQKEVLNNIKDVRLSQILNVMPSDNVADTLGNLSEKRKRQILKLIGEEKAKEAYQLLEYKKNSAGRIMTTEFLSLNSEMSIDEAMEKLRKTDIYNIHYIYVTDNKNCLVGILPLRTLIVAAPNVKLGDIIEKNIITVGVDVDQEEVASLVKKYDLRAIPVVDKLNKLVGIVTVDDILDVITKEASEDIYHMAGIKEEGLLHRSILTAVRLRLPWLIVALMGGVVAAGVVGVFEKTLADIIVLAAFIPVIMGMGGNIGTQSSTIITRGLATGTVNIKNIWRLLWRELCIGLLIGIICGVAIGIVAQIWKGTPALGIVVGTSMIAVITAAAFLGAFFPILFQRLGIDPAILSGPAITTTKDILALLIYFGVATLIML